MKKELDRWVFYHFASHPACLALVALLFMATPARAPASPTSLGTIAPDFLLRSGGGSELRLSDLKGAVALIFHETQESKNANLALKRHLEATGLAANEGNSPAFRIVAVADCEPYPRLFRSIVELALVAVSRESNTTIYGDWRGDMARDYGVLRGDSNIFLLSPEGRIVWRFAGVLPEAGIAGLIALIRDLTGKGAAR